MHDAHDPYAAPTARLVEAVSHLADARRLRIEGKCLVAPREVELPPICVVSAAPVAGAQNRKRKKLYWHSPWLYLLVLVNLILYAIVAGLARRTARVGYSLAPAVRRERLRRTWIAVGVFFGGVALIIIGASHGWFGTVGIGALTCLAGAVLTRWARVLWAERIEPDRVYLRGISPEAMRAMVG
jgi:hypothetical protein